MKHESDDSSNYDMYDMIFYIVYEVNLNIWNILFIYQQNEMSIAFHLIC